MIKQMFKLVWKRKRSNFLLTLEIFASFIVLFTVTTFGFFSWFNYGKSCGFEYKNAWQITTAPLATALIHDWAEKEMGTLDQLHKAILSFDRIKYAGLMEMVPYDLGMSFEDYEYNNISVEVRAVNVCLDVDKAIGLKMVNGRWFDKTDEGAGIIPAVINKKYADKLFGDDNPINKIILRTRKNKEPVKHKIVGVIEHYKPDGEISSEPDFIFKYRKIFSKNPPTSFVVKVPPGTTAEYESEVKNRLQSIAKKWSIKINHFENLRKNALNLRMIPLLIAGFISVSLLIMVGLGLIGVLWQNVSKRTKEIGLRRAKGANKQHIYKQISGELLLVTTLGLVLGVALAVQFPFMNLISFITIKMYTYAIIISLMLIYVLSYICALYPAYMATNINPAEALHAD